jgi:hypothetical protein
LMSKHVKANGFLRKQSGANKRNLALYGTIALGVVVVCALVLIQSNTAKSSDFKVEVSGAPRIAVKEDTVDYGDRHYNIPVESVFALGNIGDQPLMILGQPQVEVVEGCCPPRAQLTSSVIKPGEQTLLSMSFSMHAGMDGKHHFLVHVRTNDPIEPDKLLHIYSNWIP